ncbi:MAG: type IV secretory system conjugative DNA transfer family protein [Deltaproteobacteria bacterium]|nr:type IV secretory system conjugative DNA transfer family protein [Deltaproteobacteria bacterium]
MTASTSTLAPSDAGLHKKPALAPVLGTACLVLGVAFLLIGARAHAPLTSGVLSIARHPDRLRAATWAIAGIVLVLAVAETWRRLRPPRLPLYLLANRAVGYGVLIALAVELVLVARGEGSDAHLRRLLFEREAQLVALGLAAGGAALAYLGWLHPLCDERAPELSPYQAVIDSLKESYDFVLGVEYPDDWKRAAAGQRRWLLLPEHSLWTNLFVFGGIDSGKTSSLAYPLVVQALMKFKDDAALRPSIVLLDLKGDNALRLYDFCRRTGREREFWVISPGNQILDEHQRPVLDADGAPIIPRDRFLTWNPIGGDAPADLRASLLLDGLSATNDGPKLGGSAEYFENVEAEFLSATIQLLDAVRGAGATTLLDVYTFAYDPKVRRATIEHKLAGPAQSAQLYFRHRFQAMKPEDQGHLISGLTAKLSKLTSPSVRSTFCAPQGSVARRFTGFMDLVVNRPGVIVFSVPEAIYSRDLCRVLGIMFMRAFHTEVLRRSTTQFAEGGGNTKRLVMNVVDECWAFMNKGVASFTAVSRQARACSVFLTQSLDQIPEAYRATVEGNFRTKALLSVNDSLTLKRFEELLGSHKEMVASSSTNASLQGVRHGVFTPGVSGKDQGLSLTTSTSEQLRPRFSQHEIQHLPRNRAVVHLYTQQGQREAFAMEVTPWFQLRHHLFHPLTHPDLGCPGGPGAHAYAPAREGAVCARCGHRIDAAVAADVAAYARRFGHLLSAGVAA